MGSPPSSRRVAKPDTERMPQTALPVPAAMPKAGAPVVLVVDDEDDVRKMLARMLGRTYTVFTAPDGVLALDLLTKIPTPSAMVIDVMMPRVDGLEVARRVKEHPRLREVPVVFLTAKSDPGDVVAGINAGARAYMTKPFSARKLLEKLQQLIESADAEAKKNGRRV